jgi:hypothetical protein
VVAARGAGGLSAIGVATVQGDADKRHADSTWRATGGVLAPNLARIPVAVSVVHLHADREADRIMAATAQRPAVCRTRSVRLERAVRSRDGLYGGRRRRGPDPEHRTRHDDDRDRRQRQPSHAASPSSRSKSSAGVPKVAPLNPAPQDPVATAIPSAAGAVHGAMVAPVPTIAGLAAWSWNRYERRVATRRRFRSGSSRWHSRPARPSSSTGIPNSFETASMSLTYRWMSVFGTASPLCSDR